jgi:hypothetical protein
MGERQSSQTETRTNRRKKIITNRHKDEQEKDNYLKQIQGGIGERQSSQTDTRTNGRKTIITNRHKDKWEKENHHKQTEGRTEGQSS